jgi:hypothetical protein
MTDFSFDGTELSPEEMKQAVGGCPKTQNQNQGMYFIFSKDIDKTNGDLFEIAAIVDGDTKHPLILYTYDKKTYKLEAYKPKP